MNNLFLAVCSLSLCGSVVIGFVILLDKIFCKNYSRQWKYIVWLVLAIRLILPVHINLIDISDLFHVQNNQAMPVLTDVEANTDKDTSDSLTALKKDGNALATKQTKAAVTIQVQGTKNAPQKITDDTDQIFTAFATKVLITVAAGIWFLGAVLFLLYHIIMYMNFRRRLKRWSISVHNRQLQQQFDNLCEALRIKRRIRLVTCNQVASPILSGLIKPCIILPSEQFTQEQLEFILKHELIHYKRHDLIYKCILLGANALHWFNPLIHYMVYLADNDIELYCDEKLIGGNSLTYRENYCMTLLQIMTGKVKEKEVLLTTGFGNDSRQVKRRFFQIMNAKPTKKGINFIISILCIMVLAGNLFAWLLPPVTGKAEAMDQAGIVNTVASAVIAQNVSDAGKTLEKTSNVLILGVESQGGITRADSILLVSVDPKAKKIYLTSFLRDMYVSVPKHGKNKLGAVYQLGKSSLVKDTLEANFDLTIDHTVTVNMKAFEKIINSIGGVEVKLTKKEAKYLNMTNYISKKKYRTVTAGKQVLNGNQALGYVRVRKVPTAKGETNDLGRSARLKGLLSSVIKEYSSMDIVKLTKLAANVIPNVTTDLSLEQITVYLNTVLQKEVSTSMATVPCKGSYIEKVQDGMSVLIPDLEKNKKELEKLRQSK